MTTETTTAPQVTITDVATKAGVSVRTVHRSIHDPGLIGADTLAKIQAAMEELGYTGEKVRRGRKPPAVPLVRSFSGKVDARTDAELTRRAAILTKSHGKQQRGWDTEIIRLALDWAFNPPEGTAPMPEDYLGHVDRVTTVTRS